MFGRLRSVFIICIISVIIASHFATPLFAAGKGQVSYKDLKEAYYEVWAIEKWGLPKPADFDETERQYKKAQKRLTELFEKATDKGRTKNTQLLCDYAQFLDGHGEEGSKKRQRQLLEIAVKIGSPRAYRMYAEFCEANKLRDSDKWLAKAVQCKDPIAMHDYARELWDVGKRKEALNWYVASANAMQKYMLTTIEEVDADIMSHWEAKSYCVEVGIIYEFGLAGKADLQKALYWYNRAMKSYGSELIWICCSLPGAENKIDCRELIERVKKKLKKELRKR